MITEQDVKDLINLIENTEAEIKVATALFSEAKKYLSETPIENIDAEYFDDTYAEPLNNFEHIEFRE